jgi:Bacterial regulatory helix-turn-helix protein, lysR family
MKQNYTIARGALEGVEAFLRVAARRSFRQAADDLGITPSAISQTIRSLEARVGVALFTRTTRSGRRAAINSTLDSGPNSPIHRGAANKDRPRREVSVVQAGKIGV